MRLDQFLQEYPALSVCAADIEKAAEALIDCYRKGGKVLLAGNGGASADCAHIVGELMKGFLKKRPVTLEQAEKLALYGPDGEILARTLQGALPAVDLTAMQSIQTAVANDNGADLVFAQQVWGLGRAGDVLIGLSTSGNSRNVVLAGIAAQAKQMRTIALTGAKESRMSRLFDIAVRVPSDSTPRVQEYHLPIYHLLCILVEEAFWDEKETAACADAAAVSAV